MVAQETKNNTRKSKLEITSESLKKNKDDLKKKEQKLKEMLAKERSNLLEKIAPNLDVDKILVLINDPSKLEILKNAIEPELNKIFSISDEKKKKAKTELDNEEQPTA
ncbi:hypothetical protein [Fusobacterium sp. PH5-44]|uniref:hypothetical protein n=1 Tax=unclassified Fusobacterium TaxID=2648384 RepID=UPI003D25B6C6